MKLISARPFWLMRHGIGEVPSPLRRSRRCDVVIVGAGITGALVADAMTAAGLSVIAIDRRYPCQGSTAASTALLQYEIDTPLAELQELVGHKRAVAAYAACLAGVRKIGRLAATLQEEVGFRRRPSLYYASSRRDGSALRQEYRLRKRAGFDVEYLDARELSRRVDFAAPAALWSREAGEVDPWLLTQALLKRCMKRDFELYGRSEALGVVEERDSLVVHLARCTIRARHVVIAAGYEADRFLPSRVCRLTSSFALVTEPVAQLPGWPSRALIWETARPYHYLRTTADNRILVGGEDLPFRNAAQRDARIPRKAARLLKHAQRLMPRIEMEVAYAWAGTFGETRDGLARIGAHPEASQRLLFALGFGGNGVVYSRMAADILTAKVLGRRHRHENTFAFER